ncbi:MAG: hypothetical protein Q9184_003287 [Pyrenodesmia sp. 2 TL-2023]
MAPDINYQVDSVLIIPVYQSVGSVGEAILLFAIWVVKMPEKTSFVARSGISLRKQPDPVRSTTPKYQWEGTQKWLGLAILPLITVPDVRVQSAGYYFREGMSPWPI